MLNITCCGRWSITLSIVVRSGADAPALSVLKTGYEAQRAFHRLWPGTCTSPYSLEPKFGSQIEGVSAAQVDLDVKPGDGSSDDEKEAPMEQ
jgi:hypothetical protein